MEESPEPGTIARLTPWLTAILLLVPVPVSAQALAGLPLRYLTPAVAPERPRPAADGEEVAEREVLREPLRDFAVWFVSPEVDEVVAGEVIVRAEVRADRPDDVLFVEFEVDGRVLFADARPPYELVWRSGDPAPHRLVARAWGPTGQIVEAVRRTAPPAPAVTRSGAFSSRVERVQVFARVEGRGGGLPEIDIGDVTVLEDERPQPVVDLERTTDLPLALGFMVDCSGSMVAKLDLTLEAAGSFIDAVLSSDQDKAFVMSFADMPATLQEFTNDSRLLTDALELVDSGKYTKLYDALIAGVREFGGQDGRRALVVLTDGHDANSEHRLDDAIRAAQRADVAIYPVAVDLSPRFVFERWVLRQLAEGTGGRVLHLESRRGAEGIFADIAEDLHSQYRITYEPRSPGGDGEWRSIEVRVEDQETGRRYRVRARPGYFAE